MDTSCIHVNYNQSDAPYINNHLLPHCAGFKIHECLCKYKSIILILYGKGVELLIGTACGPHGYHFLTVYSYIASFFLYKFFFVPVGNNFLHFPSNFMERNFALKQRVLLCNLVKFLEFSCAQRSKSSRDCS